MKARPRNWWTVVAEDHHSDARAERSRPLATTRWKQGDPLPNSVNRMGHEAIEQVKAGRDIWACRVTLWRDGEHVLTTTAGRFD